MTTIKRTIKFRAKAKGSPLIQDGTFVYGCLVLRNENLPVIDIHGYVDGCGVHYEHTVDKDTIGQFTGLYDKNGKEIYEGDILHYVEEKGKNEYHYYREVVFHGGAFCQIIPLSSRNAYKLLFDISLDRWDVAGNIHDNPELLKGGQE